jgi:hypothetical protein
MFMFPQEVKEVDPEKIQINYKHFRHISLQGGNEEDLAKIRKIEKLFVYLCNNKLCQKEKKYLM